MRILIADDQAMLRDALRQLLEMEDTIAQVFVAADGQEAIQMLGQEDIDVAILDVEMPHKTGLDVLEWMRACQHKAKVIIVTTFKRSGYFKRAVQADVDAYVLKDRSITELMGTITRVLAGKKDYSAELMESVVANPNPLTQQEQALLSAIEEGLSNKDIANRFFLSEGTIRNYISTILLKVDAKNRSEAVKKAKENEWL